MLSVNQNMRFDQSMRVLKQLLDRGELGEPVIATIEMRAIPHWQDFLADYDRLTLLNMSIHHLDVLRFLFGDPTEIFTAARPDPRTTFAHTRRHHRLDAAASRPALLAVSLEDVWSGPREEGFESDIYIKWRVEGTDGRGARARSAGPTIRAAAHRRCATPRRRPPAANGSTPSWDTMWFPHAFMGVMEQLQDARERRARRRRSAVADNVKTMALVEAGYRSMTEGRSVKLSEISTN